MNDLLTSTEAAMLTGVGTTAIKRWSDSGALPCVRTAGGHRRFRVEDVERLMRRETKAPAVDQWSHWLDALLLDGDLYSIQARLFDERARRGSWHGAADSLGALLTEIGCRWESGALSVVDEHVTSSALQRAIASVVETIPVSPQAPRCLLATAEGDEHTLGLSLVELCLREAGWRAEWAGNRTRVSDVSDRLARGGIAMLALSAVASMSDPVVLKRIADDAAAACQPSGVILALGGGGAWPDNPAYGSRFRDLTSFYAFAV